MLLIVYLHPMNENPNPNQGLSQKVITIWNPNHQRLRLLRQKVMRIWNPKSTTLPPSNDESLKLKINNVASNDESLKLKINNVASNDAILKT